MLDTSRYACYPKLPITFWEFQKLPEYSATYPTGVTLGKRWRRHDGVFDEQFIRSGGKPVWLIQEYIESPRDPKMASVKTYRSLIRAKAGSKPL